MIRLSLSKPLIATPHPHWPSNFVGTFPIPEYRFPCYSMFYPLDCDLSLLFNRQGSPGGRPLIVLPEDVLHVIVNLCHWIRNFPFQQ